MQEQHGARLRMPNRSQHHCDRACEGKHRPLGGACFANADEPNLDILVEKDVLHMAARANGTTHPLHTNISLEDSRPDPSAPRGHLDTLRHWYPLCRPH